MPNAPNQKADVPVSDLLDRTMEFDIRGLIYDDEEAKPRVRRGADDPTVVLDLTATQVNDLLAKK